MLAHTDLSSQMENFHWSQWKSSLHKLNRGCHLLFCNRKMYCSTVTTWVKFTQIYPQLPFHLLWIDHCQAMWPLIFLTFSSDLTLLVFHCTLYANCWINCGIKEKAWGLVLALVYSLNVLTMGFGKAFSLNMPYISFNKRSTQIMYHFHIHCLSRFGKLLSVEPSNTWLKPSDPEATRNCEVLTAPLFQ